MPGMRICHVITKGSPMGGSQIDTLLLAQYQHAMHDVEVIMGTAGPLLDGCQVSGIRSHVVPMRNSLLDPGGDVRALTQLVRHFQQTRPHVVHTHTSKAGVIARAAARLVNIPLIVHTIHIPPWRASQPAPLRSALQTIERLSGCWTHQFIVVSDALGGEFVEAGICPPERIATIGSAIDLASFPQDPLRERNRVRRQLGIPTDTPVIISVANLEARKRYDVFLDAMAEVNSVRPDVFGLVAGVGDMEGWMRERIRDLNLDDRVLLLGRRDDVPVLLAASDIFVQTSELEGLSRSLIEAMYSHLPVVATAVNGTGDLVQDGKNGYLIPVGDFRSMAQHILDLLKDGRQSRRLGIQAHDSVAGTWSVDAMGAAHERLYCDLLQRESRGARKSA